MCHNWNIIWSFTEQYIYPLMYFNRLASIWKTCWNSKPHITCSYPFLATNIPYVHCMQSLFFLSDIFFLLIFYFSFLLHFTSLWFDNNEYVWFFTNNIMHAITVFFFVGILKRSNFFTVKQEDKLYTIFIQ